jgi:hypothetical protein
MAQLRRARESGGAGTGAFTTLPPYSAVPLVADGFQAAGFAIAR